MAKGFFAALALSLALAQGCEPAGNDRSRGAAGQATPLPQQAAAGSATVTSGQPDACRLLTAEDIQAVQGEGRGYARGFSRQVNERQRMPSAVLASIE